LHETLKSRIKDFAKSKNIPNLILTGPPGTGKSAAARCISNSLYNEYASKETLELNSSDGIDSIKDFCRISRSYKKETIEKYIPHKLVIINDADNMDENKVQPNINSLMEMHKKNVKFIFTCTKPSNIIESIQSRCIILQFEEPHHSLILNKLTAVCKQECIKYDTTSLNNIATISKGDIRRSINLLQLIHNKYKIIKNEYVNELCTFPQHVTIFKLLEAVIQNDAKAGVLLMIELRQMGYSGSDIMLGIINTIQSNICNNISNDKINIILKEVCQTSYLISKHTDSDLQLHCCVTEMVKKLKN